MHEHGNSQRFRETLFPPPLSYIFHKEKAMKIKSEIFFQGKASDF